MGFGRHDADAWASYTTGATATRGSMKTARMAADILTSTEIDDTLKAKNIEVREARDSALNPLSLPIVLALDCTGSMSVVIFNAIKKFNLIIEELVDKKAVEDPAIMTMFFDDVNFVGERALQVSQFESDLEATKQFEKMHIVGNGGGNNSESYHLPLYMAAFKTKIDSMEKRNTKGFLFTVGDEAMPPPLTPEQIKQVFGPDESAPQSLSYMDLWEAAGRKYHCFHVVAMGGSFASGEGEKRMKEHWKPIGQNLIILDDMESLPEVVVSTIRIVNGEDAKTVASSWSGTTAVTVSKATKHLAKKAKGKGGDGPGVAKL